MDPLREAASASKLEEYALADSPAHRLHTGAKLMATAWFIVAVVSVPLTPSAYLPFFVYPMFLTAVSGTPVRILLKRLAVSLPFSLIGGASRLLFFHETVYLLGSFAITDGMLAFGAIFFKTLLTVWAVLLLAATTTLFDIIKQLAAFGVPASLCLPLEMTVRYLSVLLAEAAAMRTAYTLRSGGQRSFSARNAGTLLGQWLLRSFDRAERIYYALLCRGWQEAAKDRRQLKQYGRKPYRPSDFIFMAFVIGGTLLICWI